MATKGGEERKGEAVPVPVVAGGSYVFGARSLVARVVCVHGLVSAVGLLLLIVVQDYHTCQGDACLRDTDIAAPVARTAALSSAVQMVAAVLMLLLLLLLFMGWWSWARSFFALLMVFVTVQHSVRLFYMCYIGGDIVTPTAVVALVAVVQLAMSFLSANNIARIDSYGDDAHSQSKRGSTSPLLQRASSQA